MATNLRKVDEREFTTELDIGVLASEQGLRSPRMVTADLSFFQQSIDGNIVIPPGYFWTSTKRVLPMSKAVATTATNSKIIKVKQVNIFKVGEALTVGATAIGAIAEIDVATNTITLAANAAAAVAIGDVLMVAGTTVANLLGMNISSLNLSERSNDVALYVSASVYLARMPIWDANIAAKFPEIVTV